MLQRTVFSLFLLFTTALAFSQTQTPVYLSTSISSANSKGFYQCLPADYNSSTKNYPLIIWVHGAGQVGQGNATDLPKVLEWGVPKIISEGGFPANFTVGDSSFSFVIISPQFIAWPSGANVLGILNYAMSNYRIDPTRVYLMGISAGGGAAWEFASVSTSNSNKLAAMISFCGAFAPTQTLANRIAASNLPVWAFHNTNDGTVPVAYSRDWKNFINNYVPAPNPLARLTEFPVVSSDAVIAHECWSLATLPTYKPDGINIYEWLLNYRQRTVAVNLPPLASAGQDQGIVLPANASLDGSASVDQDGIITAYRWRKITGPATYFFSDSTLINPIVSNLVQGVYQFELVVTDNLGAVSKDSLTINVYPALAAGTQQRVLIDVGAAANFGGTITASPNINGIVWNNMTDGRPGVRVANALTVNNQLSGINVEVINRVDGTYNSASSPGMGYGNTTGIVGDYPASATTDHVLIHSSATNGKWRISGLQVNKIYTVKFWGTRTNTTAARSAEIKRTDDNVWKTYNATGNTNYNNAAVFNITGKTEMDFDIRTKAGSDFSCINVLDIYYSSDTTIVVPPVNLPPVARAGADTSLQLPTDSLQLKGCSSFDPEMAVLKYKWRKIAGPATYQISSDTLCAPIVRGLTAGTYSFELVVTDTAGLTGKDSVSVTVNALLSTNWPPQATALCNSPYKIVVVGSSTAYGTGANPIDSSWVRKLTAYLFIQNQQIQVINIATLGLTSYDVSPTGTIVPAPFSVDTLRNITKALSLNPDAIILNLPSNDVARGIPTNTIHENFTNIVAAATARNVPVWVSTTQPRDGLSPAERVLQMDLRDWINATYGNKSIDFWSTVANADGTINPLYSAGDGVHLNNYGHHILFTRVVEEKIWDTICIRKNISPVARAGNDTILTASPAAINLNGQLSSDPDGSITTYAWLKIAGPAAGTLVNATAAIATASGLTTGVYRFELKVTDNMGATAKDTIQVTVNGMANQVPTANAGPDKVITLPLNSTTLDGSGTDPDGNIASYNWTKIAGPVTGTLTNASSAQASVSGLVQGVYQYQLQVTDNSGATAKDTMRVTVNAAPNQVPTANAGPDKVITLPLNSTTLDGSGTDPDGNIASYNWTKIAGPATGTLTNASSAQASVSGLAQGVYQYQLQVTDNSGATAKDTALVTVLAQPGGSKKINVNIYGGTNPFTNTQWNNWNLGGSLTSGVFNYDNAAVSTVSATITSSSLISDNGASYAPAITVCPQQVIRYNSANTSYRTLTISGLNASQKYNFEFYASRANTGNSTVFQIGNAFDTISTDSNINDYAKFSTISPDVNGKVVVTISRIGTWNYIAGFVITEVAAPAAFLKAPVTENLSAITTEKVPAFVKSNEPTILFPNPAGSVVMVPIPNEFEGSYLITLTDMNGNTALQKQGVKNKGAFSQLIDISKLQSGIYVLQLSGNHQKRISKLIKL